MKNIILIGIILAVVDVAVLYVMKIMGWIQQEMFTKILGDSLLILAIILLASVIISLIAHSSKTK